MRRIVTWILAISILAGAAIGAYHWTTLLANSIYTYTTPLKSIPPPFQASSVPLTSHVVLVIVDGMRYDSTEHMPYLTRLRREGARAKVVFDPPSGTQTGWTTLLTGAGPETNDAPILDTSFAVLQPISLDHLFTAVERAGMVGAISGFHWWARLVPREDLHRSFYASHEGEQADRAVVQKALAFVQEDQPNLLCVNLRQADLAGRRYGANSSEYKNALKHCDDLIRALTQGLNLDETILMVVSSHGMLDEGGYGGDEPVLLSTPLLIIGENVQRGDYGTFRAVDIAPTIAALLGISTPSAAEGIIQDDMLRVAMPERADKMLALSDQRLRIGNTYLFSIGRTGVSEAASGDHQVAYSSYQVSNYESAQRLARFSVEQISQEMKRAREARRSSEQVQRAGPAAAGILLIMLLTWQMRPRGTGRDLLLGLVAAVGYHALFLKQGNSYSFSSLAMNGLATTLGPSIQRAGLVLASGCVVLLWTSWRRDEQAWAMAKHAYVFAIGQVSLIAIAALAIAAWNGPYLTWHIPDLTVLGVQFHVLLQGMVTAALSLPLPVVTVGVYALLKRAKQYADDRPRATALQEAAPAQSPPHTQEGLS